MKTLMLTPGSEGRAHASLFSVSFPAMCTDHCKKPQRGSFRATGLVQISRCYVFSATNSTQASGKHMGVHMFIHLIEKPQNLLDSFITNENYEQYAWILMMLLLVLKVAGKRKVCSSLNPEELAQGMF